MPFDWLSLKSCALGTMILVATGTARLTGAAETATQQLPGAELLWDYAGPGSGAKAHNLHPFAGAALPDGGLVLLALWSARAGPYRAFRFDADGKQLWQFTVFDDIVYGVDAWPGIVPLLRPSKAGAIAYGYITSTRLIGPSYFTDEGKDRPQPTWRDLPPGPITALASSSDGRATVGGTEAGPSDWSPLAPCSRALLVQLDSQAREVWRWRFRAEHKSTFIRRLQYLPNGSTLAFIDDDTHFEGSMERYCDGDGRQKWVVWLDSAGRDYRTMLVADGAQWVVALSDGRIATVQAEDNPDAGWEIYWYFYAADGSRLVSERAADLDLPESGPKSTMAKASRRPDTPNIRCVWPGKDRLYLAVQWSGFSEERTYETRLAVYGEDGRLLALSPGFHWQSLIVGPSADESSFIVATPDGLYRVPMPK